jgi:predicted O-methyltransferase YrrM
LNVEGELFSNTNVADRFLVRGCPSCMVDSHEAYSLRWSAVLKTAETIRTGVPQAKLDYSAMSQDELEKFFRGEYPETLAYGRELATIFDLSSCRTLVDVGGGSGGLAIALTEACPYMQATIVDLPTVTPITRRFIAEADAKSRIKVISSDVVRDSLPGSYDIAVLSAFIQVLSPDNARRALKNVIQAINPDGTIYIRGSGIIDNSRTSPPEKVGLNLVFINVYDEGQAYTEQEYKDWLVEAGLVNFARINVPNGGSWLTAQKTG